MPDPREKLVLLPPHRVWRTQPGGRRLDALAGIAAPADRPAPSGVDGHFPDNWIASATRAVNVGRGNIRQGVSAAFVGGATHHWQSRARFFCPAGLGPVGFQPAPTTPLTWCHPPAP